MEQFLIDRSENKIVNSEDERQQNAAIEISNENEGENSNLVTQESNGKNKNDDSDQMELAAKAAANSGSAAVFEPISGRGSAAAFVNQAAVAAAPLL